MSSEVPDIVVCVCHNCIPGGGRLPRQWDQDGFHVAVREMPCSGKVDVQYMFHALEGGGCGICIVMCPRGECTLIQGNYRAEIRIRTVQNLLKEIGLEEERIELLHFSPEQGSRNELEENIREAVRKICELGKSPV
jgi:coenzyme F420-reducing hydrogenase delta subunit